MAPKPGVLYVTMAPEPSLPIAQFHDWYHNEHGPVRLRLPYVTNGLRYRANDLEGSGKGKAEWMAVYDVTDMEEMTKDSYTRLRKDPVQSQRERDTMKQIKSDRKFYDFVLERVSPHFNPIEKLDAKEEDRASVLVARIFKLQPGGKEEDFLKWYEEEHLPMLEKVPGWRRGRIFQTSSIEPRDEKEFLVLHNYLPKNGLGGPEFQASISTQWKKEIMAKTIIDASRRVYDLYYTFGPAPRDIASPSDSQALLSWEYSDGLTKTIKEDGKGVIDSYITTADGAILPYRLEGSTDPNAPLIVLSNSVLTTYGIWDNFIQQFEFLSKSQTKQYRILRYNTRGRTSNAGSQKITIDVLAADIITILDALRVPKAALIVGVSLGGATVLNTALQYPDRIAAFLSCDTNAKSPAGNSKAWGERIAIAESQGVKSSSGETLVGSELAEKTVRRWLVPDSYDGGVMEKEAQRLNAMVESNSLEGFKKVVQALYEYDVEGKMKSATVKGGFVVGSGDGVLPKTMAEMAKAYGKGVELEVIQGAGHLPMVEKPKEFAEVVTKFLSS